MPLGWERINARTTVPNKNIAFIKPLPGKDEAISKDFLERIAAQCLPIMNNNYLSVVSLEEYEANPEFLGRNFNNGEVIQLVLKSRSDAWLPFRFVQMTMMHELAHCKQMNHSAAFHRVRLGYQDELKVLMEKGYTGDGLWGRGVLLENGAFARTEVADGDIMPEHLCGGTFRSGGRRKRKVKPKISYKEKEERRIEKKFGTNGVTLGADEETKQRLEKGKKPAGKPRVAGSARGRELRAAAALARFEKKEEREPKDEDLVTDSETASEDEYDFIKTEPKDAVDLDGSRLLDKDGLPLFKVCEDEDGTDETINELQELQFFGGKAQISKSSKGSSKSPAITSQSAKSDQLTKDAKNILKPVQRKYVDKANSPNVTSQLPEATRPLKNPKGASKPVHSESAEAVQPNSKPPKSLSGASCHMCSMENEATALTCLACSNVLKPDFVPNSWSCSSSSCKGGEYMNAGDVALCGICGARKCSESI